MHGPAQSPLSLSTFELVAMVALLSALNALSIDIMLPGLPDIGRDFGLVNDNDRQLVITSYVIAFGIAQLAYGPLADAFGRRGTLLVALGIFLAGSVLCVFAPSYGWFLAARALQGVGAAATRVISVAVVRDLTEGRRMAQIMSMAMTAFMVVPIIAPSIGQLILFVAPWRWVFGLLLIYALAMAVWAWVRLPETLKPEHRRSLRPSVIAAGYLEVVRVRQTFGYMLASTFMVSCLFGYVTCSEQIYVDVFGLGALFPLAFAGIALAITAGTFINSRLVMRLGARRISHATMLTMTGVFALQAAATALFGDSLWMFMFLLGLAYVMIGMTSSNFNSLAMEPAGRVAGSASALYGAATAGGGATIGGVIARAFDGTTLPFVTGLAIASALMCVSVLWTERGTLFGAS